MHRYSVLIIAMKIKKQILSSSWFASSWFAASDDDNEAAINGQYAQRKIFFVFFNCNIFVSNTIQNILKL